MAEAASGPGPGTAAKADANDVEGFRPRPSLSAARIAQRQLGDQNRRFEQRGRRDAGGSCKCSIVPQFGGFASSISSPMNALLVFLWE